MAQSSSRWCLRLLQAGAGALRRVRFAAAEDLRTRLHFRSLEALKRSAMSSGHKSLQVSFS